MHVHVQQPAYYRGESWKLNDLRARLFMHYARECKATSSPLAVDGFSQWSVKDKLKKMRKVLGDDVMNFALIRPSILVFQVPCF